ncbi:unnamed protein product [Lactuca saligna]|uniref:Dilute domain-containing protein n=1 Tax=Lactuca saligna TaxID=75948 RepID=A0AA35VYF0_LACSI|nr:unnamed protein product [Lactuca saligna]
MVISQFTLKSPTISRASLAKGSSCTVSSSAQQTLIAHWQGIMKSLGSFLNVLKTNNVPPVLVPKVFSPIFSFVNVQLCNSLFWDVSAIRLAMGLPFDKNKARQLGILVKSDEVYAYQVFWIKPIHPYGSIWRYSLVVTLGTLSKRWIVPGWCFGWIAITDPTGILHKTGISSSIKSCLELTADPPTVIQV